MTKKKGWAKEPARHSLASRGVKTKKKHAVTVSFPVVGDADLDRVMEAGYELNQAGLEFDTGASLGKEGAVRDWELDWSLRGAWVENDRLHIPVTVKNEPHIFNAEILLKQAGLLADDDISVQPDVHVWDMGKWVQRRVV